MIKKKQLNVLLAPQDVAHFSPIQFAFRLSACDNASRSDSRGKVFRDNMPPKVGGVLRENEQWHRTRKSRSPAR